MSLPQAMPFPASLRTEWDLFRPIHPEQEVDVKPVVVTCSVVVPLVLAVPLQTVGQVYLQVYRGKIGRVGSKIARSWRPLRWELGLECRNSADQAVSALHLYF